MSSFEATAAAPDEPPADLPPVDEHIVASETRFEILDGVVIYVPPAHPPHARRHAKLAALVEAHAASDFIVAVDMLTRTSKIDDFAPDVSVYPAAIHPVTGGRQLEHLAFEIVNKQSLGIARRKAAKLVARGVRRVFAIDIKRSRALEWSHAQGTWTVLESSAHIDDPALAAPLPVAALLDAARSSDVMARALITARNPEIEAVRAQERSEGRAQGVAEGVVRGNIEGVLRGKAGALLVMLAARGLAIQPAERQKILDERDLDRLDRWIARGAICNSVADVLRDER
jgi:hypothetical protein